MTRFRAGGAPVFAALPMAALLGLTSVPLLILLTRGSTRPEIDWSSFRETLGFSLIGAAVATILGGGTGIFLGIREVPARRWLLALSILPIAAPPAFWWIGASRLTAAWGNANGHVFAAIAAGLALSPITLLLVLASLHQVPSNLYEAARVALPPAPRLRLVLLPLLRPALLGGFVLTTILLLGESELPFLFGFRTNMTDVVTTFARTLEVSETLPLVVPLLLTILVLGMLAGRPLMRVLLTTSRGSHGVILARGTLLQTLPFVVPAAYLLIATSGYFKGMVEALWSGNWPRVSLEAPTILISIIEPVAVAWIALALTIATIYPLRRSALMAACLWVGLILFCIPAPIYAIGWIGVGQYLGGISISPLVAHTSRAIGLGALGFGVGYARLPTSLENAAALVPTSAVQRMWLFVMPVIVWSVAAASAFVAALTYADRDVASLLLQPGSSRLVLNLYLASANAPSAAISVLALMALICAALSVTAAAAGPLLVWGRRG